MTANKVREELPEASNLRAFLKSHLRGQSKAIDTACKIYEQGLINAFIGGVRGPVGVMMCAGPSGTGKTELGRLLAEYLMDDRDCLIKIPCEEYSQPHMIHSLIGAPHSYLGFDKPAIFSYEHLESVANPSSTKTAKKVDEEDLSMSLDPNATSDLNMRSVQIQIVRTSNAIATRMHLVNFLKNLEDYLRQPSISSATGREPKRQSLIERLRSDGYFKDELFSLLSRDSVMLLMDGMDDNLQLQIPALIIEQYTEIMKLRAYYEQLSSFVQGVQEREQLKKYQKQLKEAQANTVRNDEMVGMQFEEDEEENNPYLVMLFDEIEKAAPTLWNLLLGIMEEGRVQLANGSTTDFNKHYRLIMLMTSNVGEFEIGRLLDGSSIGFTPVNSEPDEPTKDLEKKILQVTEQAMKRTFSPAFRGRIDNILVFRPHTEESLLDIIDVQVTLLNDQLQKKGIKLTVSKEVRQFILSKSDHRPEVGARLLVHKFGALLRIPFGRKLMNRRKSFAGDVKAVLINNAIDFQFTSLRDLAKKAITEKDKTDLQF